MRHLSFSARNEKLVSTNKFIFRSVDNMRELVKKYQKGVKVKFGENEAKISSELMKFQKYYYIVADITQDIDFLSPCGASKIHDNVALIIRNKELLKQIGLSTEERKAVYCHELGHVFSKNQSNNKKSERQIKDEIDSDTFAVKECKIDPKVLESALKKTYEYEIKQVPKKKNITKERIDRFVDEMRQRKKNIEKLIHDVEPGL